jgi:hypothetical protein
MHVNISLQIREHVLSEKNRETNEALAKKKKKLNEKKTKETE